MKFELDDYNRGVTNDELLIDLKRVALAIKKVTVSMTLPQTSIHF